MSVMNIISQRKGNSGAQEEHWIPLSDLMTGLMMMFMLVALIFMVHVQREAKKAEQRAAIATAQADEIESIAKIYNEMRDQLYRDLLSEFSDDLPKWGAQLDRDLSIRFKEPDVLFDNNVASLKPRFMAILTDFFPRYVKVLISGQYQGSIEEIRIEGHTSSVWNDKTIGDQAYFLNMGLSQARTRTVLQYVLTLPKIEDQKAWVRARLTANGLSSSKLIWQNDHLTENQDASRRVEFKVRTNAEDRISDILKAVPR
jgi:outer membrane protein OmpA-like peptidoglycan-associated protein